MKKSRRIWWILAGILVFAGIILWAGGGLFGGSEENGQGVAYFCFGGGLLIGLLLLIEWIAEVQKSPSFEKSKEKAAERRGICPDGQRLLRNRNEAKTAEERGNWHLKWGIHRKQCPICGRMRLVD